MKVLKGKTELRATLRETPKRLAIVPTMGYLHAGHLKLIEAARQHAEQVAVSIFVNPLQFNDPEDFAKYPVNTERDLELCESASADIVFLPTVEEMYPGYTGAGRDRPLLQMTMPELTRNLCGQYRPGHFDGVLMVVGRLFNLFRPDVAVFGKKDFQQYLVIRRLAFDLDFDVDVVGIDTVREPDGLALSSRNRYLDPEQRVEAVHLSAALREARANGRYGAAVALDASGALFIADAGNFRVRRVGVDGVISTLTGGARPGTSGDGGPARDALLTEPTGLTLDDRGRLYIADAPAHRVRVIEPDGVIQTLAGTGAEGRGGDGGPATAASVGFPQRVVLDAAGRLLITQLQDGVVRRVSTDGTIATLAGAPESGVVDTRPGAQAPIDAPIGLAADRAGNVYVVESGAGTIIRIGPDGLLTVIAGNPIGQGRSGDAARDVPLFTAVDVALAADGTAYVLEARGTIWRLGRPVDGSPTEPSAEVTASSSPRPTIPPAADEFAEIESITLALRLDAGQAALDPTLEFHPGERVNISIEFANVKEGSRLGIRWSAGDRALGTFLTDPQSGYGRATFGFFFNLGTSAAIGPWKVEVLVGTRVAGVAEFVVTPGEVRVQPPQG